MSWAHLGQIWGGWAAYVVHWRGEIGWDPPRPQQVQTSFFPTFLHMCTLVQIPDLELVGGVVSPIPILPPPRNGTLAPQKRWLRASEMCSHYPCPTGFNIYLNREAKYRKLWRSGAANGRFCVHNQASGTHACTGPSWGVGTIKMVFYWRRIGEP